MRRSFDAFDLALLNLLQKDARTTAERLAQTVPLSPSAIARRVRRLRREGAVVADLAVVAPDLAPGRLSAVIQVQLDTHGSERRCEPLRRRLLDHPEVQMLLDISGSFDLLLLVLVRGLDGLNAFAEGFLASEPAIRRYEISLVKQRLKLAPFTRLDERDLV